MKGADVTRFGHQIPLKAQRPFTRAALDRLTERLKALDPHIKAVLPLQYDTFNASAQPANSQPVDTPTNNDKNTPNQTPAGKTSSLATNDHTVVIKAGDRLVVVLRDSDTVNAQAKFTQDRLAQGLPAAPHLHPNVTDLARPTPVQVPIVLESQAPDAPPVKGWQKLVNAYRQITQSQVPQQWNTRYYAEGHTTWEMAASTVARVQNRLLDENTGAHLGVTVDWPTRSLPYEWRGFMMKPANLFYPLHHNERLTDPHFWPSSTPVHTAINPQYPVTLYSDSDRAGHNAFHSAYPYVHEAFTPPTGSTVKPKKLNKIPTDYTPRGFWVTLQAEKPVSVFALFKAISQPVRQHQVSTVHPDAMKGLPVNSTMLQAGQSVQLFLGSQGSMNWIALQPTIERDLAVLKQQLAKLGITVTDITAADHPKPSLDVDDSFIYAQLKHRLAEMP